MLYNMDEKNNTIIMGNFGPFNMMSNMMPTGKIQEYDVLKKCWPEFIELEKQKIG